MSEADFSFRVLSGVGETEPAEWDALSGGGNPFVTHAFLSALEDSHSGVRSAAAAGTRVVMVPDLLPATDEMRMPASSANHTAA